jgi:serine protease Do
MKKTMFLAAVALPLMLFAEEPMIGYLGVITEELSEAMMQALDVENGLLIEDIVEDSPAEKSGLKTGDIIIDIDGDKIHDYAELKGMIAAKPDQKIKILIKREGKTYTKDVTLSSRPKPKFNIQMELPDFEELKELMNKGSEEIMQEINKIKDEIDQLRKELEDLKKKVN